VSDSSSIEMIVRVDAARTELLSPGVGLFSAALPRGAILTQESIVGTLETLGKRARLVLPPGVHGTVHSKPPRSARAPVEYGQVLYELRALESAKFDATRDGVAPVESESDLSLRSPQSGRFYHRSAPGEPSLCEIGRELEVGTPIGLLEVMKNFTQITYRAERGLPTRARIVRVLARDGSDVEEGSVLLVVEAR